MAKQGRNAEAIVMMERGRGKALARQAAQNRFRFDRLLLREEIAAMKSRTDAAQAAARSVRLLELKPVGESERKSAAERLADAERRLADYHEQLVRAHPQYAQLQASAPAKAADLLRFARRHPRTLFVMYGVLNDEETLVVSLSHSQGARSVTLALGDREIQKKVSDWRSAIDFEGRRASAALAANTTNKTRADVVSAPSSSGLSELALASELYKVILGPIEGQHLFETGYERIVFVTDGPLVDLPFAALRDERGKRLVDRITISNAISLATLLWPSSGRKPSVSMLCAADPIGGTPERLHFATASRQSNGSGRAAHSVITAFTNRDGNYSELPGARAEGKMVASKFDGSLYLAGPAVRKSILVSQLPKFELLHFATHGYLDAQNGLRSGLVLAPERDPAGTMINNVLEAREIADLPLSARLAVLSACHTGQGQLTGGEGVLGLAWAFRAAGVPAVVASQWSVDDAVTREWMIAFYSAIQANKPKDTAVQLAMKIVKRRHPAPYHWAAFQLIGESSPIPMQSSTVFSGAVKH